MPSGQKLSLRERAAKAATAWIRDNPAAATALRSLVKEELASLETAAFETHEASLSWEQKRDFLFQENRHWFTYTREEQAARRHNRRNALKNSPGISPEFITILFKEFEGRCAYCGAKCAQTIDHIVPVARGGKNENTNILPACRSCNSSKGSKNIALWSKAPNLFVWNSVKVKQHNALEQYARTRR